MEKMKSADESQEEVHGGHCPLSTFGVIWKDDLNHLNEEFLQESDSISVVFFCCKKVFCWEHIMKLGHGKT